MLATSRSTSKTLLRPLYALLCAGLCLVACGDDGTGTESDGDTTSETSTSGETSDGTDGSSSTTSTTGDSGTDSEAGSTTAGDETTTAGDETTTTGAGDRDLAAACEDACAVIVTCVPEDWESPDECVGVCLELYADETEACLDAGHDLMDCYAGHACDELLGGACDAAEELEVLTCGGGQAATGR